MYAYIYIYMYTPMCVYTYIYIYIYIYILIPTYICVGLSMITAAWVCHHMSCYVLINLRYMMSSDVPFCQADVVTHSVQAHRFAKQM